MRDSDWSRENLLRSDWLVLEGASYTTTMAPPLAQPWLNLFIRDEMK